MRHFIHHDTRSNLLYLFTYTTSPQLDMETIRQVKSGNYSLCDIVGRGYMVFSGINRIALYETCDPELFYAWYQDQPLLGPFIEAYGIPPYMAGLGYANEMIRHLGYPNEFPSPFIGEDISVNSLYEYEHDMAVPATTPSASAPASAPARAAGKATKPHIVAVMLRDAIAEKKMCPITLDPITLDSVCVAPCYHCFTKEAIEEWLQTHTTCPECREICT